MRLNISTTVLLLCLGCLTFSAGQDDGVAAATAETMQLSSPFLANSPATTLDGTEGGSVRITKVTRDPEPQPEPGDPLEISATIAGNPSKVTLFYRINYAKEKSIPMTSEDPPDAEDPAENYTASIPSKDFKAGDMVRWRIEAGSSVFPALTGADQYLGTVIKDSSVSYTIPVMEWFTDDLTASTKVDGHNGSSVYYLGRFYDNLFVRRKGVTSLSWPKPKLKFRLFDNDFIYKPDLSRADGEKKVDTFDLNSMYFEPGQKSYMREAIAYQVLQDAGAISATNYHLVLRVNGEFYGLYSYVENDDKYYVERNGLDPDGILVKPTGGDPGLSPFFSESQLIYYFEQQSQKNRVSAWPYMHEFLQGIAGNSDTPRSKWVFDNIELSETINTMAVLTMLLTQDRCTKNFLVYRDPSTTKWQLFGYDLKSAMNSAAGYGGSQSNDYCTLTCTQWNSPLYCDRDHPQDTTQNSTNPWNSIQPGSIGKKLLQSSPKDAPVPVPNAPGPAPGGAPSSGPEAANIIDPDENLVALGLNVQGPAATFNYLIDLITQVPDTRQMYLRRLRTLTDYYYPTGKLIEMITNMYNLIKSAADIDNEKWNIGSIDLGYKQLTEEQIPTRQEQLLTTYGPDGSDPLLPDTQPSDPALTLGRIDLAAPAGQRYVEITNPLDYAVDVSNWKLSGAITASIKPGTVIASGNSLIVVDDGAGFRQRTSSPMLGEGIQAIGKLTGGFSNGQPVALQNAKGQPIDTKKAGGPEAVAG